EFLDAKAGLEILGIQPSTARDQGGGHQNIRINERRCTHGFPRASTDVRRSSPLHAGYVLKIPVAVAYHVSGESGGPTSAPTLAETSVTPLTLRALAATASPPWPVIRPTSLRT